MRAAVRRTSVCMNIVRPCSGPRHAALCASAQGRRRPTWVLGRLLLGGCGGGGRRLARGGDVLWPLHHNAALHLRSADGSQRVLYCMQHSGCSSSAAPSNMHHRGGGGSAPPCRSQSTPGVAPAGWRCRHLLRLPLPLLPPLKRSAAARWWTPGPRTAGCAERQRRCGGARQRRRRGGGGLPSPAPWPRCYRHASTPRTTWLARRRPRAALSGGCSSGRGQGARRRRAAPDPSALGWCGGGRMAASANGGGPVHSWRSRLGASRDCSQAIGSARSLRAGQPFVDSGLRNQAPTEAAPRSSPRARAPV